MIFCKSCGYESSSFSATCPSCKNPIVPDARDIAMIKECIEEAKRNKETETVTEGYHILAEFGDTEGEREWARILERGDGAEDVNLAMDFYRRAAEKFDALSAYKYSELLYRVNTEASRFWLEFSAFLGYPHAFLEAAKSHLKRGEADFGNHYSYLAATSDDTDAIVFLAERYYRGEDLPMRPDFAKWYLDKLTFPPFYAFKLSFKLRSAKAAEAPNISVRDKTPLARRLLESAKALGFDYPAFYLTSYLFENGDTELGAELGEMYLSGIGVKQNSEEGIRVLTRAAAVGSGGAYMSLGRLYYAGVYAEKSLSLAVSMLKKAASLNITEAYTLLGDIYNCREFSERNIPTALSYYLKGADGGDENARAKAQRIAEVREEFYRRALESDKINPTEAFKNKIASAAMGHPGGKLLLAEAYATGKGTKKNRSAAFSIWKNAAEDGITKAHFPLGLCYAYGFGTQFNFREAMRAFGAAHKRGEERAKTEAKRLIENKKRAYARKFYSTAMRLIYKGNFAAATGYLEASRELYCPKAIYTLGCLYEFGRGVTTDKYKAYALYNEADRLGFLDTRSKYKLTILKMLKK